MNPASTIAVVGGQTGSIRIVSLSKGEVVGALGGHKEEESVESVVFVDLAGGQTGNAGVVVTGGTDGKACIWDLSTNRIRATLEHGVRFYPTAEAVTARIFIKFPILGCGDESVEPSGTEAAHSCVEFDG